MQPLRLHAVLAALWLCATTAVPAADQLLITEFMAANSATLTDETGAHPDWIEIGNLGTNTVNLENWCLTDSAAQLTKWRFPSTNLPPGGHLVVFASGNNRRIPGAPLHTSFSLGASGEFLALVRPDGSNIVSAYAPVFPRQARDVSFGIVTASEPISLIDDVSPVRVQVPVDGSSGLSWTTNGFNDAAWIRGTNGAGYDTGLVNPTEDTFNLVPFTAAWKYLVRTNDIGTTAWRGAGFDDSAWPGSSGVITFPADEPLPAGIPRGTALPLTAGCRFNGVYVQTIYFRTAFNLAGPTNNLSLIFTNVIDDGAVFYLNGQEIGPRGNLPAAPAVITWNTPSTSSLEGTIQVFEIAPGNLLPGTNILAVELHNSATSSSDTVMGLSVVARRLASDTGPASSENLSFAHLIRTDLQGAMQGRNSSAYARFPFTVSDPARLEHLTLRLNIDDGFVAYLNGERVAARNAGAGLPPAWNAAATAFTPDSQALAGETISLDAFIAGLRAGTNILAVHGLNTSATNQDFLVRAALDGQQQVTVEPARWRYFAAPTPGQPNGAGTTTLGAVIASVTHTPALVRDQDDIAVTAQVRPSFDPVTAVTLRYRVMWGAEIAVPMLDDGAHGDGAAGDGLYGATIPASGSLPRQMVRWYVTANDAGGGLSREPLFATADGGPEYFGTVIADPGITTQLPVFHYFVQNTNWYKLPNDGPFDKNVTNASVFYLGRFYDRVAVRIRGASSVYWKFPKQSVHFDFHRDHRFYYSPDRELQDEININALWVDKGYVRNNLSMQEVYRAAGVIGQDTFFVLSYLNGGLHSVATFIEEPGAEYLRRHGLDPSGAYYKMYNPLTDSSPRPPFVPGANPDSTQGVEKRTRRDENNADLQAVIDGVRAGNPARATFLFDNFDIPQVINYFAASVIIQDWDRFPKNTFMYRDTAGTRLWQIHPWDADLSWGYNGWQTDEITAAHPTMSHPLYGDFEHGGTYGGTHVLNDAFYKTPALRDMFLRRLRTVLDTILQEPGTPAGQRRLENRLDAYYALMGAEVEADKLKWGLPFGTNQTFLQALGVLRNNYIGPRRINLYGSYAGPGGLIPPAQFPYAIVHFGAIEPSPSSGNQAQEYFQLTNRNPFAIDLSGWRVEGAVQFDFKPGTVIPSNGVLHLSPDVVAFRARTTGPRGGQGLFVLGNYRGQLSARGESLRLYDPANRLVQSTNYPGTPSLAQQFLRVTEIMYHPATRPGDAFDADEYEYLELRNTSGATGLDLNGVRFTDGIAFAFAGGAVTNLAPGASVLVVRNLAAFTARHGSRPNIAGQYFGGATNFLDNSGDRLRLVDAAGEEILDFTFSDGWYGLTDGLGFSLVVFDELAAPDAWNNRLNWRASGERDGSPGQSNPPAAAIAPVLVSEVLTRSDNPPPFDSIELFNPTAVDVNVGGWFLTDDFKSPNRYRIPDGTILPAGGRLVFDETQFNPSPGVPPSFSLGSTGDEVWLFSADAVGNLTGYVDGFDFGAAEDGVTFGRLAISTGELHVAPQATPTLGAANSGPRVGPVVINEVMYHPPDAGGADNTADEFIELLNITGNAVALHDPLAPTNTWRLTDAVSFAFPAGAILPADGHALVVTFDPATEVARAAAFRSQYQLDVSVPLYGPYRDALPNSSGRVELKKPTTPQDGTVPYVIVDRVEYHDDAPWPVGADGIGLSLQRWEAAAYGNDPANWIAAPPAPGASTGTGAGPVITLQPAGFTALSGETAQLEVAATGTVPLGYQWRLNGASLPGATNAMLRFQPLQAANGGIYDVLVFNPAGAVLSSNVTVAVILPPVITQQPTNNILRAGQTATFSVGALSPSAGRLTYQWRLNGTDLPGRTNATLTLTNVQPALAGTYLVEVADPVGTVRSDPVILSVVFPPAIGVQPVAQSVVVGGSVTFSVQLTNGTWPLSYQWRRGTTALTNLTLNSSASFFTLRNVRTNEAGNYRVFITNIALPTGLASSTAALTVLNDADADGVPDIWMLQHFGHIAGQAADRSRAADDADSDGMVNRDEYIAGTNPTNAVSYLRIIPPPRAGPARLEFAAVSNRTYSVEYTDSLGLSPWQRLADVVARTNSRTEVVLDPAGITNRVYRLVTPRQP